MAEKNVRWGIVGAGRIAHRFARSLAHEPHSELVAISCRSAGRAAAFAAEHGVPEGGTFSDDGLGGVAGAAHAALLARPDVDAVYLALPHGMHLTWAVAALRAGKAVLCEKPACASAAETRALVDAARTEGVLLMEAMKTRFTPLYRRVRELVAEGAIGELMRVEALLENDMGDRIARGGDYMSDPAAGGILLDSGIYCAAWIDDYLPGPHEVVSEQARWDHGIDCFVDAELALGAKGEKTARLATAADTAGPRTATLVGTAGKIVVEDMHRPQRAVLLADGAEPARLDVPYPVDDFYDQIAHFTDLLRAGLTESPVMSLAATLRCAELLDAVRAKIAA
ncbi:Gfo/Idh/MocA family oxidoreductase [Thermophilibacter sp. ET337]|uniref:Gfo/Idh/MocA family protein n=1 Tax=Thermophilibacter sp. ET337 TaxID=2973084 RepID=UPI0021ABD050|nr:Gfo/Idh/MocA family oxidoreductase [Thermophilibacter sp. ET337]MCR8907050.1 Gfo/Idh/MocA family oxidoreductase [Thermophilibacter sp. ET337]